MVSIVLNSSNTGISISTNSVQNSVSTRVYTTIIPNRIDALDDVTEATPANNSTLIYNEDTDRYVVKQMTMDYLAGDLTEIDGGVF